MMIRKFIRDWKEDKAFMTLIAGIIVVNTITFVCQIIMIVNQTR